MVAAVFACSGMLITCAIQIDRGTASREMEQHGSVTTAYIPQLGILHATALPATAVEHTTPRLLFMAGTTHHGRPPACGMYLDPSTTRNEMAQHGNVVTMSVPQLGTLHAVSHQ